MNIAARNAMLVNDSILPKGARWVKYLESTGTQYVDTGIKASPNLSFTLEFRPVATGSEQRLFGVRYDIMYCYGYYGLTANFIDILGQRTSMKNVPTGENSVISVSGRSINFNGTNYTSPGSYILTSAYNCLLFAWNRATILYATARVYRLDMGNAVSGEVLRHFRPIAIGNTGYMLDLVSGEYLPYGNKGTGEFIIGSDISRPAI